MSVRVVRVGASVDTQQRLPYNRNAPRKIKDSSSTLSTTQNPPTVTLTASTTRTVDHVFELLKRPNQGMDDLYLGYEQWLPSPPKIQKPSSPKIQKPSSPKIQKLSPPKVQKPQTVLNAAALAYLGDCIYEDALLQKLMKDNFLTEEERNVLRWGKNISSAKTRTKKRAGAAVYNRASSLETLIGHLYLTDMKRLEEVMVRLGFSTDSSQLIPSDDVNEPTS